MKTRERDQGKRLEAIGDGMELGFRLGMGIVFAVIFSAVAWWVGSTVWVGLGILGAVVAFPVGFLVGVLGPEVYFLITHLATLLRLLLALMRP